jgi:thiamine-monophosphate kinase
MESQFIAWLRERLRGHRRLLLGPGDDAAVLRLADRSDCVVTTDLLTDGVDFELAQTAASRIGHKALAVNLSDLAAMAAQPVAAVVALALPHHGGLELARELYEGMLPLAERFDLAIAGGDTNSWDGGLVIAVTAIGETTDRGPLTRSGAKPGDRIVVTGQFGGSILGRHLDVEPRVAEALVLHQRYALRAGIDCSDGLSLDLARICSESDCGAVIDVDSVPIAAAAIQLHQRDCAKLEAARQSSTTPRDYALGDGEDFELILAVPPEAASQMIAEQPLAGVPLTDIGEFVSERGLWQRDDTGRTTPLVPKGWEHELR